MENLFVRYFNLSFDRNFSLVNQILKELKSKIYDTTKGFKRARNSGWGYVE